jgi:hypothetical protein
MAFILATLFAERRLENRFRYPRATLMKVSTTERVQRSDTQKRREKSHQERRLENIINHIKRELVFCNQSFTSREPQEVDK